MTSSIARLKITLDDVKPAVTRRVEVPLTIRLDRLHLVLQAAMGWTNSHLYEIRARGVGWGVPDPDFGDGPLDARKTRLLDVIEDTGAKTLKYLYDFGDGWEHTVKVERITDAIPGLLYPFLIDATGRCPPEGVGGPRAMPSSSRQLATRSTNAMPRWSSGPASRSIPTPTTSKSMQRRSTPWPGHGHASQPPGANQQADPRPAPSRSTPEELSLNRIR